MLGRSASGWNKNNLKIDQIMLLSCSRSSTVGMNQNGDHLSVTANVVGNFPGSPAQLDPIFELAGGRIKSLKIS